MYVGYAIREQQDEKLSMTQSYDKENLRAVILKGSRDFGRCPIASRLSTALWPLAGKTILEHLLASLADQGIVSATVCSQGEVSLLRQSIQADSRLKLEFLDESLPVGTAGCIRDAARNKEETLFLVFPASIICPPKIDVLLEAHINNGCDLTVVFNPDHTNIRQIGSSADIYVCGPNLLRYVPKDGYSDIKEGLIPEILRSGGTIHAAVSPEHVGNFRSWQGYLNAVTDYLKNCPELDSNLQFSKESHSRALWTAADVQIDTASRIYGPVVVLDGAIICEDAVVIGPTIIGRNVFIDRHSIVSNSVLWDGVRIGSNCQIKQCLIDYNTIVRRGSQLQARSLSKGQTGVVRSSIDSLHRIVTANTNGLRRLSFWLTNKSRGLLPHWAQPREREIAFGFGASLVLMAFVWCYWSILKDLWNVWRRSDEYSSGLLVPFLAIYILWSKRDIIAKCPLRPCAWGVLAFVAAQAIRLFGLFFMYRSAERLSVVLSIAALVLLLFGSQLFRKVSTVLLFMFLMLPWPNRIQTAVTGPLQSWATSSAVFCLEVLGYEVVQEGNIIHIGKASVAVAEACNGLRMITAFFVISGLVVLLVRRAWWEKLIVLISSLPIALLCNTIRLALTALAFTVVSGEYWEKLFHDFGGYAMMPLALATIVVELWLLTRLTMVPLKEREIVVTRQKQ